MPKRHRNINSNNKSAGSTQRSCALSFSSVRRAFPALPGRAPQVGEAELLSGVTQASAEPETGAILFGTSHITSTTVDSSLLPPEVEGRNSRALGMGQKPDGDSHPSSISIFPLRTNVLESPPLSAPSPSGGIPIKRPLTLANSGTDPTTNSFCGLSQMEVGERQEGAEGLTTNSDTFKPPYIDLSVLNDYIVSHSSLLFPDKQLKLLNISLAFYGKYFHIIFFLIPFQPLNQYRISLNI